MIKITLGYTFKKRAKQVVLCHAGGPSMEIIEEVLSVEFKIATLINNKNE